LCFSLQDIYNFARAAIHFLAPPSWTQKSVKIQAMAAMSQSITVLQLVVEWFPFNAGTMFALFCPVEDYLLSLKLARAL
jgi:predicted phosphatase